MGWSLVRGCLGPGDGELVCSLTVGGFTDFWARCCGLIGWRDDPWLARAACWRVGQRTRTPPAVGPRRPAGQLEFMVVAVEPVADGGPRLRGAAARPGAVHWVRPRLHRPRSRRVGRPAVYRRDGHHRRRGGASGH